MKQMITFEAGLVAVAVVALILALWLIVALVFAADGQAADERLD